MSDPNVCAFCGECPCVCDSMATRTCPECWSKRYEVACYFTGWNGPKGSQHRFCKDCDQEYFTYIKYDIKPSTEDGDE